MVAALQNWMAPGELRSNVCMTILTPDLARQHIEEVDAWLTERSITVADQAFSNKQLVRDFDKTSTEIIAVLHGAQERLNTAYPINKHEPLGDEEIPTPGQPADDKSIKAAMEMLANWLAERSVTLEHRHEMVSFRGKSLQLGILLAEARFAMGEEETKNRMAIDRLEDALTIETSKRRESERERESDMNEIRQFRNYMAATEAIMKHTIRRLDPRELTDEDMRIRAANIEASESDMTKVYIETLVGKTHSEQIEASARGMTKVYIESAPLDRVAQFVESLGGRIDIGNIDSPEKPMRACFDDRKEQTVDLDTRTKDGGNLTSQQNTAKHSKPKMVDTQKPKTEADT